MRSAARSISMMETGAPFANNAPRATLGLLAGHFWCAIQVRYTDCRQGGTALKTKRLLP
jgi:hypothetical protein